MNTRVPDRITSPIRRLCNRLKLKKEPIFVNTKPADAAVDLNCFENVNNHVEKYGGSIVYGWNIWYCPGLLMEAEFHAVWRSPDGELLDITPHQTRSKKVLFVPDPDRQYRGRQIDNVRIALSKDPLAKRFIELNEELFVLMNTGELANQHGEVFVNGQRYHEITSELAYIRSEILSRAGTKQQ